MSAGRGGSPFSSWARVQRQKSPREHGAGIHRHGGGGGLDVSADRRAYASAERSHSVEVGEDEEVEQLMQMHDDLVGGGDSNQD